MATLVETPTARVATQRAAIYARISREDEGNVDNTDTQVEEGQDHIDRMRWQCVDVYVDNNLSAYSKGRRPGYERLIADVQAGNIDVIVCTS
jgi:site-specific DNA recombinase